MVMALPRAERSQREQRQGMPRDPREAGAAAQRLTGQEEGVGRATGKRLRANTNTNSKQKAGRVG